MNNLGSSGDVTVFACAEGAGLEDDGSYWIDLPAGPCEAFAQRRDSTFTAYSDVVEIEVLPGQVLVRDFTLDAEEAVRQ